MKRQAVKDLRIPRCFYPDKYNFVYLFMLFRALEFAFLCNVYFWFEVVMDPE